MGAMLALARGIPPASLVDLVSGPPAHRSRSRPLAPGSGANTEVSTPFETTLTEPAMAGKSPRSSRATPPETATRRRVTRGR